MLAPCLRCGVALVLLCATCPCTLALVPPRPGVSRASPSSRGRPNASRRYARSAGWPAGPMERARINRALRVIGLDMIFDQVNPAKRSQLDGRTYASDPALFKSLDKLNDVSSWTDPVIFCDRTNLSPPPFLALKHFGVRFLLVLGFYFCFPLLENWLQPLMYLQDGTLNDEVRVGLTGSFLPGVGLLFSALFSYTISLLVGRQSKIEEMVNQEVSTLDVLVLHLQDFYRRDRLNLEYALQAAWRHTDTLIFQSRYQEILSLVQDDPVEEILKMIIDVDEVDLATDTHLHKTNIHREELGFLRASMSEIIRLRTNRLSSEGRVLPPAHFVILGILASSLLFGFTLASIQPPTADTAASVAFESRVLFTLLGFCFVLLLEFALDLTNPFEGRYKVRRTTSTALLIKIRNGITETLGVEHVASFDRAYRRQKKQTLEYFAEEVGVALPRDV